MSYHKLQFEDEDEEENDDSFDPMGGPSSSKVAGTTTNPIYSPPGFEPFGSYTPSLPNPPSPLPGQYRDLSEPPIQSSEQFNPLAYHPYDAQPPPQPTLGNLRPASPPQVTGPGLNRASSYLRHKSASNSAPYPPDSQTTPQAFIPPYQPTPSRTPAYNPAAKNPPQIPFPYQVPTQHPYQTGSSSYAQFPTTSPYSINQTGSSQTPYQSITAQTPYQTGSSQTPYQTGSSQIQYQTSSGQIPYQTGSSQTAYQTGSGQTPYNTGSGQTPYQTGSSQTPYYQNYDAGSSSVAYPLPATNPPPQPLPVHPGSYVTGPKVSLQYGDQQVPRPPEDIQLQVYDISESNAHDGVQPPSTLPGPQPQVIPTSPAKAPYQNYTDYYSQGYYPAPTNTWVPAVEPESWVPDPDPADGDPLARVYVHDGASSNSFLDRMQLTKYLRLYPEADNDQGCRAFRYGTNTSSALLIPLFERLNVSQFSVFPYGISGSFPKSESFTSGICACDHCSDGRLCGQYVLQKNFHFILALKNVEGDVSLSPKIESFSDGGMTISDGKE